jgi:ribosomal protein L37E
MPDEETDYDTIRECLADNPDVNAEIVSEMTGIDSRVVLRMLDSGLISNIGSAEMVKCGQCGSPAISHSKKLCQACLEKLNQKMILARKGIQQTQRKKIQLGEFSSVRSTLDDKRK